MNSKSRTKFDNDLIRDIIEIYEDNEMRSMQKVRRTDNQIFKEA